MLHEDIKNGIKEAMKSKDAVRLSVLRNIASAFTNELVSKGRTPQEVLQDEEAVAVIKRLAKQRIDSIQQFEAGGRPELAATEKEELTVLETFFPTLMTREQIKPIAQETLSELGVTDKSGIGKAIGAIMKKCAGNADGNDVKAVLEELLT